MAQLSPTLGYYLRVEEEAMGGRVGGGDLNETGLQMESEYKLSGFLRPVNNNLVFGSSPLISSLSLVWAK